MTTSKLHRQAQGGGRRSVGHKKILEDNYNLNSLSGVAEFLDLMPITGRSEIYVRKLRNSAQIDAVYDVEDAAGIMESIKASLTYRNFDESINAMNLMDYGEVGNNIFFDLGNNSISISRPSGFRQKLRGL
jgi:hypothetical protein